jgi:5-methylcytosine-specific restriction endonuclease McrA
MEPNYARPSFTPVAKPLPHVIKKDADAKTDDRAERAVKKAVDARDGKQCRCCGRRGDPEAKTALGKIHRAHIKDASLGGPYVARNLVSLCWICHALVHAKKFWFVGTNANKPMRFRIEATVIKKVFGPGRTIPPHVLVKRAA